MIIQHRGLKVRMCLLDGKDCAMNAVKRLIQTKRGISYSLDNVVVNVT
jgi:hypothetical protein